MPEDSDSNLEFLQEVTGMTHEELQIWLAGFFVGYANAVEESYPELREAPDA